MQRGRNRTDHPTVYTPEQRAKLLAIRKVRRAAGVAGFSGWTTAVVGALALPFGIASTVSLVVGASLVALGVHELRARSSLLRLEPGAPKRLARHQLALGAAVAAYAAFMIFRTLTGETEMAKAVANEPALGDMGDTITALERVLNLAVYGTLIACTLVGQPLMAWYHSSRARWVEQCRRLGVSPDPYAAIAAQSDNASAA